MVLCFFLLVIPVSWYVVFFYILLNWSFPFSFWGRGVFSVSKSEGRRSRLDIIANILDAARRRATKTYLMLHCGMSFCQLKKYLHLTLESKLLVTENDGANLLFKTSGKGKMFLESYENLKGLME